MTNDPKLEALAHAIHTAAQEGESDLSAFDAFKIAESLTVLGYQIVPQEEIPEAGTAPIEAESDPQSDQLMRIAAQFIRIAEQLIIANDDLINIAVEKQIE